MKRALISLVIALFVLTPGLNAQLDSVEAKMFQKVEVEAYYPGGDAAWRQYLQKNLKPGVPVQNNAPSGKYTVWVQFIVQQG